MNTVRIDRREVKLIAHRGVSGLECENTNAAFVAAGNRSYWGIETDVHKTADGQFVIIHDDDTKRVSGEYLSVENSTYDMLSKLRFKDIDGTKCRSDLKISTLSEYLSICKKYDKSAVVELKNSFKKEDIAEIVEIVRKMKYLDKTVFISFVLENLICLRELLPEQKVQFLVMKEIGCIEEALKYRMDIDIHYPSVTRELVDRFHKEGLQINCWTCDDSKLAEKLIDLGVDYITTNILE